MSGLSPLVWRSGTSLLGGLVLALSFPPFDLGVCPLPAGVALMTLAVRGAGVRLAALAGLLGGLAFMLMLLRWMTVVGVDAWLLVSAVCAVFFAAMGAGTALVTALPGWPVWVACLWVAQEALRARLPLGGFPWGRLVFGDQPLWFASWASVGGTALVTFLIALCGTLIAWAAVTLRTRPVLAAIALAAVIAVPLAAALVPTPTSGRAVTVALVQGNVPRAGLDFLGQREAVLDNHVEATLRLADEVEAGRVARPDLVVWPENSTDIDPLRDPSARERIDRAVDAVGVPVLVGAVLDTDDRRNVVNAGIVWDPDSGPGERYAKRHLVPFGEYVPFRSLLGDRISRLGRVARDFVPGDRPGVLTVGPARVGAVICFEVAYDGLVRDAVRGGGEAIVVQTNNATYGRTGQPRQQALMTRVRAIEHARPVLVASTSGISQVVDPDGSVRAATAEFEQVSLVERVELRDALTWGTRVGAWVEWLLTIVGMAAVLVAIVARRRERTGRTGSEPS